MVLATVSRGQRDPEEAIAAWTTSTVKPRSSLPATSASTATATSSRRVRTAGLRPPQGDGSTGDRRAWFAVRGGGAVERTKGRG